jgi:hypothetical protein
MSEYVCYHCGATLHLLMPPNRHRVCSNCGRRLRVCENCEFYDVSGCVRGGAERHTVLHGGLCTQFEFRVPTLHPAEAKV